MSVVSIIVIIGLVFFFLWLNFYCDKKRIQAKAEKLGYRDVTVSWSPLAPGFLFERNERHYRVTYFDNEGEYHSRYCKTSVFTGVYWREEENA